MKKTLLIALVAFVAFSCDKDSADIYRSFAVKTGTADQKGLYVLDNGTDVNVTGAMTALDAGTRILMDFEKLSDPAVEPVEIKVLAFAKILTKPVIALTPENSAEVGNDPFRGIYGIGISAGYININFSFNYSGVPHLINMIQRDAISVPADGIVNLEFRQNANGIMSPYRSRGLVSFDISEYRAKAEELGLTSIKFKIAVRYLYGQPGEITLDYKVDNSTDNPINLNEAEINNETVVD